MTRDHRVLLWQEFHKLVPRHRAPARRLTQPSHDFSWAKVRSVTIALLVRKVNGAPESWRLRPRLEIGMTSTSGYQDTNAFWKTLPPADAAKLTREGAWLPDLDQGTTLPGMWMVTIDTPPPAMRINLGEYYSQPAEGSGLSPTAASLHLPDHPDALQIVGGSDPNLQIALVAYPKGR